MTGRRRGQSGGFTIAEIVVACVVVTAALLGVYGLFRQATDAQARTTIRLRDRDAAQAAADHLAAVLSHGVRLSEDLSLELGRDGQTRIRFLRVAVCGSPAWGDDAVRRSTHVRLYEWDFPADDPRFATLTLRMQPYAGTRNLSPGYREGETDEGRLWDSMPAATVAANLRRLTVAVREIDRRSGGWRGSMRRPEHPLAARITARVGDETVERIVAVGGQARVGE